MERLEIGRLFIRIGACKLLPGTLMTGSNIRISSAGLFLPLPLPTLSFLKMLGAPPLPLGFLTTFSGSGGGGRYASAHDFGVTTTGITAGIGPLSNPLIDTAGVGTLD